MHPPPARQADNRRIYAGVVATIVMLILVATLVMWWQSGDDGSPAQDTAPDGLGSSGKGSTAVPAGAAPGPDDEDGKPGMGDGIGEGPAGAPDVVQIFELFDCAECEEFDARTSEYLYGEAYYDEELRVVRYPLTIDAAGEENHRLAALAYACGADIGDEAAQMVHLSLMREWDGSPDVQSMWDLLRGLTVLEGTDFGECLEERRFEKWVDSLAETATRHQAAMAPTVFVNGERVHPPDDPEDWSKAIAEHVGG